MTSKSFAVLLSKHLYLIQLVAVASIGMILCTYTGDSLVERVFGRTYGIQILPDTDIIEEVNSGT